MAGIAGSCHTAYICSQAAGDACWFELACSRFLSATPACVMVPPIFHVDLKYVPPQLASLEITSQTYPEVKAIGDSRYCQQ